MATILVADDEESFNEILTDYLTTQGHTVTSALDGVQALQVYEDCKPDIVIADIRMPKQDGLDFLLRARNNESHQAKGIILISGRGNTSNSGYSETVKLLGAADFLHKPFPLDAIKSKIDDVLAS